MRDILKHIEQQQRLLICQHILPDVEHAENQRGDGIGQNPAALPHFPEEHAAEEHLLHNGGNADRQCLDELCFLPHILLSRLVVRDLWCQ